MKELKLEVWDLSQLLTSLQKRLNAVQGITTEQAAIKTKKVVPITTPAKNLPPLGALSKKYESGKSGPATVSTGLGDPGGVSYGTYQLSSKTGTCARFVKKMKYTTYFKGTRPGTPSFSKNWRYLANHDEGGTFAQAQHQFIKETHFDPVRKHANKYGITKNQAVNQVLWSISVQHGRAKSIVTAAAKGKGDGFRNHAPSMISALYDARKAYVRRIKLPANTRKSLLNRYTREKKDALIMLEGL
jgi:hypothetical protein